MLLLVVKSFAGGMLLRGFAGFESITLRASLAAVASFVLALALGPRMIAWLKRRFREPIKCASPAIGALQQDKAQTPTMGGLFVVAGLLAAACMLTDCRNGYVLTALALTVALAGLGACDDLIKLTTPARGMAARTKLVAQTAIAVVAATALYSLHTRSAQGPALSLPVVGGTLPLGWWFIPWATLVIVASSNAVNLADGLDGLAPGCLVASTAALAIVVYACGHAEWARYLNIPHVVGGGEMTVVACAMLGGLLGFLWFNCHPASVFMGNTGALPLGGLLGLLALVARQELLLVVIGGVFVVETLSVIAQVASFRWRKKRILLCAPLHHHFQLKGWSEDKVVVRFWIAAALCAILGLATLKVDAREAPAAVRVTTRGTMSR